MLRSEFESKLKAIEEANTIGETSDNVSIFIGLSLLVLGIINGITDVPEAFIIGASLSGLFFTMADIAVLGGNFKKSSMFFTAMGVVCLFLLPIILIVVPSPLLGMIFGFISDMGTFYALGIVMIALGWKSRDAKGGFIKMSLELLKYLGGQNEQMKNELADLERERNEIIEEYENKIKKMDQLENELENIKELLAKNNPNQY